MPSRGYIYGGGYFLDKSPNAENQTLMTMIFTLEPAAVEESNENSIQPKHKIRHPFSVTRAAQLEKSSMPTPDECTFNFVYAEYNCQSVAMCRLIILEESMRDRDWFVISCSTISETPISSTVDICINTSLRKCYPSEWLLTEWSLIVDCSQPRLKLIDQNIDLVVDRQVYYHNIV